jgi:hypothetical protein
MQFGYALFLAPIGDFKIGNDRRARTLRNADSVGDVIDVPVG